MEAGRIIFWYKISITNTPYQLCEIAPPLITPSRIPRRRDRAVNHRIIPTAQACAELNNFTDSVHILPVLVPEWPYFANFASYNWNFNTAVLHFCCGTRRALIGWPLWQLANHRAALNSIDPMPFGKVQLDEFWHAIFFQLKKWKKNMNPVQNSLLLSAEFYKIECRIW